MSSIRTRTETGFLFFDFRYRGVRCREQTTLGDTPENRKRMQKLLDQVDAALKGGTFHYPKFFPNSPLLRKHPEWARIAANDDCAVPVAAPAPTPPGRFMPTALQVPTPPFRDFCELWIRENEPRWRVSTRESVVGTVEKHLMPRFGMLPLGDITRSQVLLFRADLSKLKGRGDNAQLSAKTVNHIVGVLKAIVDEAATRYGFVNPVDGVGRLRQRQRDIEPFTLEEVKKILTHVREDYRNYFAVRFFTGMRTGEVDGLKWKFVDFARRQILVRETWTKGRTEYTKTDGSQRNIEMSSMVFDALEAQAKVSRGRSDYVFCDSIGGPLAVNNVSDRVWAPLLRLLDLPYRRMYQTRHTCATLWLAAGENPEWIARQLGHVNTEMLFKTYSRYVPNLTRRDGSAFDRLIVDTFLTQSTVASVPSIPDAANDGQQPVPDSKPKTGDSHG